MLLEGGGFVTSLIADSLTELRRFCSASCPVLAATISHSRSGCRRIRTIRRGGRVTVCQRVVDAIMVLLI